MDRTAKVRAYRKRAKKRKKKQKLQQYAPPLLIAVCGVVCVAVLALHMGQKPEKFTYVTHTELASLLSFLPDGSVSEELLRRPGEFVTQSDMRRLLRDTGLLEVISAEGGSDALTRSELFSYYAQMLDYLDVEESVQKRTRLFVKKTADGWLTDKGNVTLKKGLPKLSACCAYDVYMQEKTVLGVCARSDRTRELAGARVVSVDKKQLKIRWKKETFYIACQTSQSLQAGDMCTFCIQDAKVTGTRELRRAAKTAQEHAKQRPDSVRVLLLNNGSIHYDNLYLTCDRAFRMKKNKKTTACRAEKVLNIKKLKLKKGKSLTVVPAKTDGRLYLTDAQGKKLTNGYFGSFTVYRDKDGYYIVNKVNIEKYLYSVVASEMPASFATEALKAQAVCARSYVYRQMETDDYDAYHAQIDDSTNYQVYNLSQPVDAQITAVDGTEGLVMYAGDDIVNAYYFSSSCGYSSGMEIWNKKGTDTYLKAKSLIPGERTFDLSDEADFRTYISKDAAQAYDSHSRYFRWKAKLEPSGCVEELRGKIKTRRELNPENIIYYAPGGKKVSSMKGFGGVTRIACTKRSVSGAVLELTIGFEFGRVKIKSEYNIRSILGCAMEQISYADGSEDTAARFLPSAYFTISYNKKSGRFLLSGGGNGHGMGMSQYGADGMAAAGMDYRSILQFFYDGIKIRKI